jgi:hypothetical protein
MKMLRSFHFPFSICHFSVVIVWELARAMKSEKCQMEKGK